MGNTAPSVTGPDRGRSHVIRKDNNSEDSQRRQRPVRSRIEDRDAQLADKLYVEETNRKSSSLNVPELHLSYNGALQRGAKMSSDIVPTLEVAEEIRIEAEEASKAANFGNGRDDKTMCQEITSSDRLHSCEQNKHDENWPFCIKEIGRRRDEKSDTDSLIPCELGRRGIDEQ